MAWLDLEGVSKVFPGGTVAVRGLSLAVAKKELLVLLGPSGCGKTTTLRLIAGIEQPSSGEIRIGGRLINRLRPAERNVALVFQNYALYPHLSVYKNLAFALHLREGVSRAKEWFWKLLLSRKSAEVAQRREEIDRRVREIASLLGIESLLKRLPWQLSGGEQQRVALGRAMVRRPAVFLFDEPLSNLEAPLRTEMRRELRRLHRRFEQTGIYVTHDQTEALTLGDRIAVMNKGEIQQVGTPLEIYHQPKNRFVAGFIGTPPMNFVEGELAGDDGLEFRAEGWSLRLPSTVGVSDRARSERRVVLGFRPQAVQLCDETTKSPKEGRLHADVIWVETLGDAVVAQLRIERIESRSDIVQASEGNLSLTAKWNANSGVVSGDRVEFVLNLDNIYLFDPQTGDNLGLPEMG